jgi:hypothetical protein
MSAEEDSTTPPISLRAQASDTFMDPDTSFSYFFGDDGLDLPSTIGSSSPPSSEMLPQFMPVSTTPVESSMLEMIAEHPSNDGFSLSHSSALEGVSNVHDGYKEVEFSSFSFFSPRCDATVPHIAFPLPTFPGFPLLEEEEPKTPDSMFSDTSIDAASSSDMVFFPSGTSFMPQMDFLKEDFSSSMSMLEIPSPASPFELQKPSPLPVPLPSAVKSSAKLSSERSYFKVDPEFPWQVYVKDDARREKIQNWKLKKIEVLKEKSEKKNAYQVRKDVADRRLRIKGRFVGKCLPKVES